MSYSCAVVQDGIDRRTATRGATCFAFFLALLYLSLNPTVAPHAFCLRQLSNASPSSPITRPGLSSTNPSEQCLGSCSEHTSPCMLLSRQPLGSALLFLLAHSAGGQPRTCPVTACMHHQRLDTLKAKPKAIRWPIKWFGLDLEKNFFFLSLFFWMLSIFSQVIEMVCKQKSIQPEKM